MGDFELFFCYFWVFLLGIIIYNMIHIFFSRDILKSFGLNKLNRKDFYECGFSPQTQKPIRIPIQFLLICIFFLIYDIELVFLFPLSSGLIFFSIWDILLLIFFFFFFAISLFIDYERHALWWQY